MVAAAVLVIGITGLMGAFTFAVSQTAGQGEDATRTAEYAQDKMEQLMSLTFNDATTDTTAGQVGNGTGLGGVLGAGNTAGGVIVGSPTTGYVDYLDSNGGGLSSASGAYVVREWKITEDSTTNLKTLTVLCYVVAGSGGVSSPSTTLVSIKGNF